MEKKTKIILALLLFLCLADMPYGYFQFVRFIAMLIFGALAYNANDKGHKNEFIIYCVLALLFQPLFKIALGRTIWNAIDVMVGIGLLISAFNGKTKNE